MLPIPDGSWVTGEFIQNWTNLVNGHAYIVLTLDDGIVFKVLENLLEKESKLTLYSLNPLYPPYDVHVSQIKEVWQFVHYISTELPPAMPTNGDMQQTINSIRRDVEFIKSSLK